MNIWTHVFETQHRLYIFGLWCFVGVVVLFLINKYLSYKGKNKYFSFMAIPYLMGVLFFLKNILV